MDRHEVEAADSWGAYVERNYLIPEAVLSESEEHRRLKHHKHLGIDLVQFELDKEEAYLEKEERAGEKTKKRAKHKHEKRLKELYADSGIRHSTVHGMMIDAGSTGSRLHLYEWEPRILSEHKEVQDAVSGKKLSYPESESRWTDRLRPGLATFAVLSDDKLVQGIADYLSPLIDFAQAILREKQENFESFPMFLRATAGMRTLSKTDRSRVLGAVRTLFSNNTYCPFYFENEFARVLSGEEEAIFGWAGINFVMGNLVEESEGAGTVVNPKLTYGALDMGGASSYTQIYPFMSQTTTTSCRTSSSFRSARESIGTCTLTASCTTESMKPRIASKHTSSLVKMPTPAWWRVFTTHASLVEVVKKFVSTST
jgi:hypothetical protein